MKKIAIVTKYMMAGGIEKALINMLNTFSKEKCWMYNNISIF